MMPRRLIFLAHRYIGLGIALILALAAVTGTILAFRDALDAALNPDLFGTAAPTHPGVPPAESRIPPIGIAVHILHDHPGWTIRRFDLASRPGMNLRAIVTIPHHLSIELFLNPTNGAVIGERVREGGLDRRHIVQGIHLLHTHLGLGPTGRWIMGLTAAAWTLATLLGLLITIPKRSPLLTRFLARWKSSRPMLKHRPMPELHRVLGLWTLPLLLSVSATAFGMSFFNEVTKPILSALSPPRAHSPLDVHRSARRAISASNQPQVDIGPTAALTIADRWAAHARPGDRAIALSTTTNGLYGLTYTPKGTLHPIGLNRRICYVDSRSGQIAWIDDPVLDGTGTVLQRLMHPLHTWQITGPLAPVLATLGGLATFALSLTGLWPWACRTLSRRHRRRQRAALASTSEDIREAA